MQESGVRSGLICGGVLVSVLGLAQVAGAAIQTLTYQIPAGGVSVPLVTVGDEDFEAQDPGVALATFTGLTPGAKIVSLSYEGFSVNTGGGGYPADFAVSFNSRMVVSSYWGYIDQYQILKPFEYLDEEGNYNDAGQVPWGPYTATQSFGSIRRVAPGGSLTIYGSMQYDLNVSSHDPAPAASSTFDAGKLTIVVDTGDIFTPIEPRVVMAGDTTDKPVWRRAHNKTTIVSNNPPYTGAHPFDVIPFFVSEAGDYFFRSVGESGFETAFFAYKDSFDPTAQLKNIIGSGLTGDPSGENAAYMKLTLVPGVQYYMVETGYMNSDFGQYILTYRPVNASAFITVGMVPEPMLCGLLPLASLGLMRRARRVA